MEAEIKLTEYELHKAEVEKKHKDEIDQLMAHAEQVTAEAEARIKEATSNTKEKDELEKAMTEKFNEA